MTPAALIAHTLFATAVIVCYTVLSATGHDGNALLGVLLGQGVGGGIQIAASKV
jgi:hypothetical protein